MRRSRLLWPVCGPTLAARAVTDQAHDLLWPGYQGLLGWSGRRESNPHDQLGRLGLCH
jgi:hypothetical protein